MKDCVAAVLPFAAAARRAAIPVMNRSPRRRQGRPQDPTPHQYLSFYKDRPSRSRGPHRIYSGQLLSWKSDFGFSDFADFLESLFLEFPFGFFGEQRCWASGSLLEPCSNFVRLNQTFCRGCGRAAPRREPKCEPRSCERCPCSNGSAIRPTIRAQTLDCSRRYQKSVTLE
jgi:hypothetical protein